MSTGILSNSSFTTTGIAGLDRALGDKLQPGNLIGVIGCSGAGKTILATQIIRHALKRIAPEAAMLISTDTSNTEVWERFLSAEFGINYTDVLNRTESSIITPSGTSLPHPAKYGNEAVFRAQALLNSAQSMEFFELDRRTLHDQMTLGQIITAFEHTLPDTGGIVVLDFVEMPSNVDTAYEIPEMMISILSVLREAADRGKLLVFAFAQAQPESTGKRFLEPSDTAYYHDLFAPADAFIGIGQELGDDDALETNRGFSSIYRKKQTLNVFVREKPNPIRVPVTHRFEFQRIEDRNADEASVGNYLPFTRTRFRELCSIGLPTCINLYAFLAIHARYRQNLLGASWHSRMGISNATGLSEKQLRTATKRLESMGLIKTKRRGSGTLLYAIQDWDTHHTAALAGKHKEGYVRIYRSMAEKEWLFGNPDALRLWLFILMHAQVHTHHKEPDLTRGRLRFDPDEIEHEIGMKEDRIKEAMRELQAHDSAQIIRLDHIGDVICVTNWDLYQVDV